IVASAAIPVMVALRAPPGVSAVLGGASALFVGLLSLLHSQENWIQYRDTAEALKKERISFVTQTGAYMGFDDDDALRDELVSRVEGIVSVENQVWQERQARQGRRGR